ncbi:MAG: Restriction endonuclease S subunit, partial [Candidatus Moranbacteria bacterium GW2011_GWF2_37_7]
WQRQSTGSTFAAITKDKLTDYKIPMPPLDTQKQIVAKLSAVQDYKKQLLRQKAKLKELFDSALAESMTSEKSRKMPEILIK